MMYRISKYSIITASKLLPCVPLEWWHGLRNRAVLKDVLKKLAINCVLDVGGNTGQYGRRLRQIGYHGHIISFEPIMASYEILKASAAKDENWSVFPYALGGVNEKKEINVMAATDLSSFLVPREDSQNRFKQNRVERKEEVQVWRLDNILDTCLDMEAHPRLYLKLDTQGFDLSVMEGAQNIIPKILGLQTEISLHNIYHGMPSFLESISKFQSYGFNVIDFVTLTRERDKLSAIEMDCIMVNRNLKQNNQK